MTAPCTWLTHTQYGSDMDEIHALAAAVSSATGGAKSVDGGNWQIFEGMLYESGATRMFNTQVSMRHCVHIRNGYPIDGNDDTLMAPGD